MKTKLLVLLLALTIILGLTSCGSKPSESISDVDKLKVFASQGDNLKKLGWNLDAPESWDYVEWAKVNGELRLKTFAVNDQISELTGTLDLSDSIALERLDCGKNGLTSIDVSNCLSLKVLGCGGNQLTSLDVSGCSALERLHCPENRLTSLDVSGLNSLTYLSCYANELISLDLSDCSALEMLFCGENQLAELNVSGLSSLKAMTCEKNQLTSFDISGLNSLKVLDCSDNDIGKDELTSPGTHVKGINDIPAFVKWNEDISAEGALFTF